MGRQAHLARLALGRSPFEAPLQDEDGEFVLGPNVQHDTGRDYVQDFDSRGHPRNIASQIARRRLQRAQNEVLSTVGVVVQKAKTSRSPWQTMTDVQIYNLTVEENTSGAYLGIAESILQKLSTHWILNFRRRVLTYKSYLGLPIPRLILSDWYSVGPRAIFLEGFFASSVARISRHVRITMTEKEPGPKQPEQSTKSSQSADFISAVRDASLQLLWFGLEYPFYSYSVLQALHLLPSGFSASLFVQNISDDLLNNESGGSQTGLRLSSAALVLRDMQRPFVLALLKDRISIVLFPKLYVWIRELLAKPNRPDAVSLQAAGSQLHIIPGKITIGTARSLAQSEGRVPGVLDTWLSYLLWLSQKILHTQRIPMSIELSTEIEAELIERSARHYETLVQRSREHGAVHSRRDLRVMAIRAAFHDFNLDPETSMADILHMADAMSAASSNWESDSAPDHQEVPATQRVLAQSEGAAAPSTEAILDLDLDLASTSLATRETLSAASANPAIAEHDAQVATPSVLFDTSQGSTDLVAEDIVFQPAIPLELLLESAPREIQQSPVLRPASPSRAEPEVGSPPPASATGPDLITRPQSPLFTTQTTTPPSPVPGISRAASLAQVTPRPARRRTISSSYARSTIQDELFRRRQQEANSINEEASKNDVYRVTILSNHAAEAFAFHAASMLESIILLPLDVMFMRALAQNFLAHNAGNQLITRPASQLDEVWPLGFRAQMRDLTIPQELQFWGHFLMTIAMQGLTNYVLWAIGTQVTSRLGARFGWGKF